MDILDIGCATGHYLRVFFRRYQHNKYTGVDIDPCMLEEARRIWSSSSLKSVDTHFVNADVQDLASSNIATHDITICSNAFMYFKSPFRALSNMIQLTSRFLLIRSYFMDVSYRIIRSQTSEIHDKSSISEAASISPDGDFISFDFWSIYSYAYIESVVKSISPDARIEWLDDINDFSSIELENNIGLLKRSATTIEGNQELVYPFYLPWKTHSIVILLSNT